jgi:hypothetical protein
MVGVVVALLATLNTIFWAGTLVLGKKLTLQELTRIDMIIAGMLLVGR